MTIRKLHSFNMVNKEHTLYLPQDYFDQTDVFEKYFPPVYDFSFVMDGYYRPMTDHLLESNLSSSATLTSPEKVFMYENLNKMEFEEDENKQDNYSQTSTSSCVSKMDYTLPKYRNNVSPAIDKLMRMMNMPSLITPDDSYGDLLTNRISSPNYCFDNKHFPIPIKAKEHLDICFSSPKPFINTYKTDITDDCARSKTKEIDLSLSQTVREPMSGWQEIADSLPDVEPVAGASHYKVKEIPRYITIEKESR